jgi:hypothetical protein
MKEEVQTAVGATFFMKAPGVASPLVSGMFLAPMFFVPNPAIDPNWAISKRF